MFESKIESLEMTPGDWAALDAAVPPEEYRRIVLTYQRREEARRPRCGALFGVCRYNNHGICGYGDCCRNKRAAS